MKSTRVGASLLALTLLVSGCGNADLSPEETARAFIAAVRSRDASRVLERLDATTRTHLDRMAELATDRVGGRRVIEAHELFQVVSVDVAFDVSETELIEQGESSARVKLVSPAGETAYLDMVREPEGWRVSMPALRDPGVANGEAP